MINDDQLLRLFPEMAHLPEAQRQRIWRQAYWRSLRHWQTIVYLLIAGIGAAAVTALLNSLGLAVGWRIAIKIIILILAVRIFVWLNAAITARYVREQLPHCCLHCGYDIRASPDRCPECGNPVSTPPSS